MASQPNKDTLPVALIKIGGSVITQREGGFDEKSSYSLAKQILDIVESGLSVVIVHGGGSFAKRVLVKHKVKSDFISPEQQVLIDQFRKAMERLNYLLLGIFESAGLRCVSIIPHTVLASNDGDIVECDSAKVRGLLVDGIIPVLYSDILTDRSGQYYTCSSDKIASYLTKLLRPKAALFLTDVDGVYEHYLPESDGVKPLAVADATFLAYMPHNYTVGQSDMYEKLAQAIACAPFTELCCILNGRVRGNIVNALQGKQVGTRIM
jgi:isopentenyl phosphate kinase